MENYLGRLLDNRYEILEVIGTGGMAVVYKALDHRLNRLVAVKILKDEFSRNQEFRRRFHAESQAVAMLSHPNIVSVYDVSRSGDVDYIVMELIEGITLKQYLEKKGCLNWRETLHFAMQIAKALEDKGYKFDSAQIEMVPQTYQKLEKQEDRDNMEKMLDLFEEDDDVQNVWHNWDQE